MRTKRGGEAPSFRVCTWCGAGTWSFPADAPTQSSRRAPKDNVKADTNLRLKGKKGPPARGAAPKGLGGVEPEKQLLRFADTNHLPFQGRWLILNANWYDSYRPPFALFLGAGLPAASIGRLSGKRLQAILEEL